MACGLAWRAHLGQDEGTAERSGDKERGAQLLELLVHQAKVMERHCALDDGRLCNLGYAEEPEV